MHISWFTQVAHPYIKTLQGLQIFAAQIKLGTHLVQSVAESHSMQFGM